MFCQILSIPVLLTAIEKLCYRMCRVEDLVQVIDLTTELIYVQGEGPSEGSSSGANGDLSYKKRDFVEEVDEEEDDEEEASGAR